MAEVELLMPKMGESIIEATIIGWLKKEGDQVDIEESVLEIATDKVDSEVPSPVAGTLKKILHQKDAVVTVGQPLALIETEMSIEISSKPVIDSPSQEDVLPQPEVTEKEQPAEISSPQITKTSPEEKPVFQPSVTLTRKSLSNKIPSNIEGRFFSPLVRNIARAEGISAAELSSLAGSGEEGRVTKFDLLNYIDDKRAGKTSISLKERSSTTTEQPIPTQITSAAEEPMASQTISQAAISDHGSDEIIELSRMRRVIANHMIDSLATSAHVSTFIETDATRLVNWRSRVKDEYLAKYNERLTLSPLFTEAVIQALRDHPRINASLDGNNLVIKKLLNIGIATAMKNGNLIVPVIKNAGHLNLHGLTKTLNDITGRARANQLKPDEIQGGTFTISNIGTFGNIMGTPIINQPQLAILALGAIKKKPVIHETPEGDIIAIRHMMFLSLSFDHRVIDGYLGGIFLNRIAHYIENFDANRPI